MLLEVDPERWPAQSDAFAGYRRLAAEVVRGVVADGPAAFKDFAATIEGEMWLAWLGLDEAEIMARLERRQRAATEWPTAFV